VVSACWVLCGACHFIRERVGRGWSVAPIFTRCFHVLFVWAVHFLQALYMQSHSVCFVICGVLCAELCVQWLV